MARPRLRRNLLALPLAVAAILAGVSSAAGNPGGQAPTSTSAPSISGTAAVGSTVRASLGNWRGGSIGYALNWLRCDATGASCSAVSGATAASYSVVSADAGSTLRVVVYATNKAGTSSAQSAPTAVVPAVVPPPAAPADTAPPQIAGTTVVGQVLTASSGSWTGSPTAVGLQWTRCNGSGSSCSPVAGATASSYKLASADAGDTMRVVATATNTAGSTTATSAATPVVSSPASAPAPSAPLNTAAPQISGTAQVGQTLAVSDGTWTGSPTSFAYQWQRCDTVGAGCAPVSGAAAKTYTPAAADAGATIRVSVAASNATGTTVAVSAATGVVPTTAGTTTSGATAGSFGIAAGGNLQDYSDTDLAHYLDLLASAHARWLRFDINWQNIQYAGPTSYNWAPFDRVVNAATARGLHVLGVILYTPPWARPSGTGATTPPSNLGDYATFARAAAQHYGPLGVHAYEIWNEPNITFWSPSPDPARYTQMLKLAYTAIKGVDPSSVVVSAGLSPYGSLGQTSSTRMNPITFLQQMYANGAHGSMDAVGWHPYAYPYGITYATWSAWSQMSETPTSARSVMAANGDGALKIWATEFGEPTGTTTSSVTEAQQAQYVTDSIAKLKTWSWAGPAFFYSGRDNGTDMSDVENAFGLITNGWRLKPSYAAFAAGA